MQQPPLSAQIKAIERELDVQLFRRKPRGVELTDAGRAFFDDARAILAHLDRAFERTRRRARGEQGQICVGVTPTCMYHPFVPQVVRAFREAFPQVLLKLEESRSTELFQRLADERIDAAFVRILPGDPSDLVIDPLLEEPMVVALPSGHLLARQSRRTDCTEGACQRNFHYLRRPAWPGDSCRCVPGISGSWLQPVDRPASPSPRIDAQPGCCRPRRFLRSGFAPTHAHGRRGVSSAYGSNQIDRPSETCVASRRPLSGNTKLSESNEKIGEDLFRGLSGVCRLIEGSTRVLVLAHIGPADAMR